MLTPKQIDTITEIVNIGVGKGSASLGQMVNAEILLNVPYVNVVSFEEVLLELQKLQVDSVHAVELTFSGEYEGNANIILSEQSAAQLASLLVLQDPTSETLLQMKDGIMIEVGNIILNGIMGSFGNILDAPLDYHMPKSFVGDIKDLYNTLNKERFSQVLICRTNFSIRGKNVSGEILIMYEMNSFDKLTRVLDVLMER